MKRVARTLSNLSMRQKLILSSIVCLLLPAVITVSVSTYFTREILEDRAVSNSQKSLEMVDLYISNLVSNVIYVSNYIQFDSEINTILKENWKDKQINQTAKIPVSSQAKITRRLENITSLLDKIYITVLTPGKGYYSNYSYYDYHPSEFFVQPWFEQLQAMPAFETFWLGTQPNYIQSKREKDPYLITIARTMKSFSAKPYGYMVVSMNESQFNEVFQRYSQNQEIMMINSKGVILSHYSQDKIGQYFPYADQLLLNREQSKIIDVQGEDYLLVSRKLAYSDWQLVSLTPYKDAVGRIHDIQRIDFIIQILFFSIFLIILVSLVRQLTKPVFRLGRVAAEIQQGNLAIRSGIRGDNEIGRLGQSFDQMLDRIEEMIEQITVEQAKKRKAELEMLQAQINPHFLFNILNSIRMKVLLKKDEENAELIQALSSLLRMTINRNNEFIPMHEELEIVVNYVKLMNFRRKEKINCEVDMASDTMMDHVPRFFIQPFIENAYIHGFKQGTGHVKISVWKDAAHLMVSVEDDGQGMNGEQVRELLHHFEREDVQEVTSQKAAFSGIGVRNVYARMKLIYGDQFEMQIQSPPFQGTRFLLYFPSCNADKGVLSNV